MTAVQQSARPGGSAPAEKAKKPSKAEDFALTPVFDNLSCTSRDTAASDSRSVLPLRLTREPIGLIIRRLACTRPESLGTFDL